MALFKTDAVVIGRRALGESDRLVDFYTREFGKVRGVARAARRPRSRFGSALEPFTLGRLVFFESGRSELVRVDHFDILHPFVGVRERLDRLGRGAWVVECLSRLSADRDPHPALYGLLVRSLRALEGRTPADRVALCFAVRAVDLLGHRPRIDRCVRCGRLHPPAVALDMVEGGLVCVACGPGSDAIPLAASTVGALARLRGMRWDEALALALPASLDGELTQAFEGVLARLIGHSPRSSRFITQTRHVSMPTARPPSASRRSS